jgi:DNA polymerase-1
MLNYKLSGGHSLEKWGQRLGFPKDLFDDFSKYSKELEDRCVTDVEITHKLYETLVAKGITKFQSAINIEHKMQMICNEIKKRGFAFDHHKAMEIYNDVCRRMENLEEQLRKAFPPIAKPIRVVTPRETKQGTISKVGLKFLGEDLTTVHPNSPFTTITWQIFNPGSVGQVVERLNAAGWKPTEKTTGHIKAIKEGDEKVVERFAKTGWKVSETNLATLPEDAPEASHSLVEYILLKGRKLRLEEWFRNYDEDTHSIHGTINPIGTWPHRVSHKNPNMGNVPTKKSIKYNDERHRKLALYYGEQMRRLWKPHNGYKLVGCDATAAHLRILAHLCNDKKMIDALLSGDIHTENKKALGRVCRDRDQAKTFIYSFINGAQAGKVGEILNCSFPQAKNALDNFGVYYPGFGEFKENQMEEDWKRGYIYALDGRPIIFPSKHTIIAAHLLSGEMSIMKHANVRWHEQLTQDGIDFYQLGFIHDEWQTEVEKDDDLKIANHVGQVQADSIRWASEQFGMNIPMSGEYNIGDHWYDTH